MANSNHGKQKPMKQEESKRNREKRRKITKIIPLKKDDLIYKCAVCNNVDGSCLYAVCEGCQYRHMSKKRKKLYQMMNVEKVVIMNYTTSYLMETYGGVQNLKLMDRSGK